jgi:hypothetical protein
MLFSRANHLGVYESLCNPPGGDWSGINILDFKSGREYRWTSLPRVSGLFSKRPDHLIEFNTEDVFLSVESKDLEVRLEDKIGPRLIKYVSALFNISPVSYREKNSRNWIQYKEKKLSGFNFISGAAFRYQGDQNLQSSLKRGKIDIVFAVEFKKDTSHTVIHILASESSQNLLPTIKKLSDRLGGLMSVVIH